jgi:serine/threonine protein kinase
MTELGRGAAGYRAPELVSDSCYTTKVDIWSLGCVTYELLTRLKPFSDDYEVYSYSQGHLDLGFPDSLSLGTTEQFIWHEVRSMLDVKPSKRPKARSLHQKLRSKLSRLSDGRGSPIPSISSEISDSSILSLEETGKLCIKPC